MSYLEPLYPLLLVVTIWFAARTAPNRDRNRLLAVLLVLFLVSWPPLAWLLLWPIESRYSHRPPVDKNVQAIVVLSSAVFPPDPPLPEAILGSDTYERTAYAAWLHKHWKAVPVLATGGGSRGMKPYALTMAEALAREGVPEQWIWVEKESTSTYENASFSARLLRTQGIQKIVLVTEAYHMPRSSACFRKQGLEVVEAPCGFRIPPRYHWFELLPTWEAISWNEDLLHEGIGFAWYAWKGRV